MSMSRALGRAWLGSMGRPTRLAASHTVTPALSSPKWVRHASNANNPPDRGLGTVVQQEPDTSPRSRTVLYDFHKANGAVMVPFAGYDMPLSYGKEGHLRDHEHVRSQCGLFDVGHMVQHLFTGPGAQAFLESLIPTTLSTLKPFSSTLSVLLNEEGGIIDDLILCKQDTDDMWYVVTNAGCRAKDLQHFKDKLAAWTGDKVEHGVMEDYGLLALQGPWAERVLAQHCDVPLTTLHFGNSMRANVAGVRCHVIRAGYTGEDGFEISVAPADAQKVAQALLDTRPTLMAGLAVRDSLRIEAGMCLYGQEMTEQTSPVEAGLTWLVSKDRREKANFPGAERILREIKEGPPNRRVGLIIDKVPGRQGCPIMAADGETVIGKVTSGIPSPTLGVNIAMGTVKNGHHKKDTEVKVNVRGALRASRITPVPFVPNRFYRG